MVDVLDVFYPIAGYVFVTTITPGPNNLMLAASGHRFGYRKTVPHLLGVASGFTSLVSVCALGLGGIIDAYPGLNLGLRVFASVYLIYLVVQLVIAPAPPGSFSGPTGRLGDLADKHVGSPLSLFQAALFQYANPKAWIMASTGVALVSREGYSPFESGLLLTLAFLIIGVACNHAWILSGMVARHWFSTRRTRLLFNLALCGLSVYAVFSIWHR